MNYGLVSIITPCYNGEKYIGMTLDSVLAQTYKNWELIVVDDGSKDSSVDVVSEYMARDERIQLIRQKNAGSAAARNAGIKAATGRYVALLDADDIWKPEFLEAQLDFMQQKNAACVFSAYDMIDADGRQTGHTSLAKERITVRDMRVRNHIGCLTGLYDARKYGKVYLREELKSLRDDYAYWYDIVSRTKVAYGNQRVLASYRVTSGSVTGKKASLIRVQYKFYRKYLNESPVEAAVNLLRWCTAGVRKFVL